MPCKHIQLPQPHVLQTPNLPSPRLCLLKPPVWQGQATGTRVTLTGHSKAASKLIQEQERYCIPPSVEN